MMGAIEMQISDKKDASLSIAVQAWIKQTFVTPSQYAHAAQIDKRTARARFDEIEPREPSLAEIQRAVQGRWASFKTQVLEPVFETPDYLLEAKINELKAELARRKAENDAVRFVAAPLVCRASLRPDLDDCDKTIWDRAFD
jgi:hypothetical protein